MILGITHKGSGIGNQLHRYVATRVLALDKGYDFGMIGRDMFKGKDFMSLDMGKMTSFRAHIEMPAGKLVVDDDWIEKWEEKTNYYNPEFNFIEDNTIIDGEFQDERYFGHRMPEIKEWLKVEPIDIPDNVCVIGFRGGEFYMFPELGLPKEYFDDGIRIMREINPNMKFQVHTDDQVLAKQFFPDFEIIQNAGVNWRSVRNSRYSIVANSSFYILPRLLKHHDGEGSITVAPRYWARRNTKEWSMPQNYYKSFKYI